MRSFSFRQTIITIILVVVSGLIPLSCTKSPINGDLDGQWEVMDVYPSPSVNIIPERLYYNFSLHVCMLSYYGGTFLFANMVYDGDTLILDFAEDKNEEDILALQQYGILTNPVTFKVKYTDKHHLTLYNDQSEVILVKH